MDWKSHLMLMLMPKDTVETAAGACSHEDVVDEQDTIICLNCGEIISKRLVTENAFTSKITRRRPTSCPVYADIPDEFNADVKNLAVIIYKTATTRRIYRSTLRKAIIAACLYRASVMLKASTRRCFTAFGLSNTEANRGIVFVALNLPPGEYTISLFGDKSEIYAACLIAGISEKDAESVLRLFENVKHGCNGIMASSQRISIIYGCVWMFIKTFLKDTYPNTIGDLIDLLVKETKFTEKKRGTLPVSAVTVNKKYNEITKFILSRVMKKVFAQCLALVCCTDKLVSKTPTVPVTLYDCTDVEKITAIADDGFIYPLEDVDDVTDWNVLFEMVYEDGSEDAILMPIKIVSKSNSTFVSFEECCEIVADLGPALLSEAIRDFIKNLSK